MLEHFGDVLPLFLVARYIRAEQHGDHVVEAVVLMYTKCTVSELSIVKVGSKASGKLAFPVFVSVNCRR